MWTIIINITYCNYDIEEKTVLKYITWKRKLGFHWLNPKRKLPFEKKGKSCVENGYKQLVSAVGIVRAGVQEQEGDIKGLYGGHPAVQLWVECVHPVMSICPMRVIVKQLATAWI